MTGRAGHQLSTLLHALGGGRGALPPVPPRAAGAPGSVRRVVEQFGAQRPVQADPTTCGSAALVVLAAAGDPRLARWLATGDGRTQTARFADLQQTAKAASTRHALLGLDWPGGLGTPPWGAAKVARFGRVRYTHRLLVDTDPARYGLLLDHVIACARAGVPVPLYTGGDTRAGVGAAVPRHVVVLTSPDGSALEVYEPSVGRLIPVTRDELAHGGARRPAYGGWSHLTWALLPLPPT